MDDMNGKPPHPATSVLVGLRAALALSLRTRRVNAAATGSSESSEPSESSDGAGQDAGRDLRVLKSVPTVGKMRPPCVQAAPTVGKPRRDAMDPRAMRGAQEAKDGDIVEPFDMAHERAAMTAADTAEYARITREAQQHARRLWQFRMERDQEQERQRKFALEVSLMDAYDEAMGREVPEQDPYRHLDGPHHD